MPTTVQFRRGTTSQNDSFTGAAGEISVDSDLNVLRVHDNATAGGEALVGTTATQTLTNKTLGATTMSGNLAMGGNDITGAGTLNGIATSAKYADLAERYTSDSNYEAGTVIIFGGEEEVTESTQRLDKRIAGIVSTDPAYLMNSALENSIVVGLQGRVPCKVVGEIRKGDLMVSSATPGHAEAWRDESNPPAGSVIGKALENKTGAGADVIEVVVGKI